MLPLLLFLPYLFWHLLCTFISAYLLSLGLIKDRPIPGQSILERNPLFRQRHNSKLWGFYSYVLNNESFFKYYSTFVFAHLCVKSSSSSFLRLIKQCHMPLSHHPARCDKKVKVSLWNLEAATNQMWACKNHPLIDWNHFIPITGAHAPMQHKSVIVLVPICWIENQRKCDNLLPGSVIVHTPSVSK